MALVLASEDRAQARRLQRLAAAGELRRLYPGVYTDDLVQPLESIVRRELLALCSLVAPGSILSHRSALEGGRLTAAGNLFLTGANRRDFELPGVKLRMAKGVGPLDSDIRIPTFAGNAFVSSQARALLENLTYSRGNPTERRTLGAEGVENWLARFISRDVSGATNKIRDAARGIAGPLGLESEFKQLDKTIGAVFRDDYISALKAMSSNSLPTPLMRMLARAARFSHWAHMSSKASAFADLKRSNAPGRPETDRLSFDDSLASAPLEQ